MVRSLGNRHQAVAFLGKKPLVALHHLDAPVENVVNTMSRAVIADTKLKIFQAVVCFRFQTVMHRFVSRKRPTEELLHDVTVFQNVSGRLSVTCRNSQQNISASNSFRDRWQSVFLTIDFADPFVFTLPTAQHLFAIKATAAVLTRFPKRLAAVLAGSFISFVGIGAATESRTFVRAIERVFPVLLSILSDGRARLRKRFAAMLASEVFVRFARNTSSWPSMRSFIGRRARFATEPLRQFSFAGNHERDAAVFADFFGVSRFAFRFPAREAAKALIALGWTNIEWRTAVFACLCDGHSDGSPLIRQQGDYPVGMSVAKQKEV